MSKRDADSPSRDSDSLAFGTTVEGPPITPSDSVTPVVKESRDSDADVKPAASPARVGRYVIIRQLGEGGMGIVYLAYDPDLDRKVAIKLVRGSSGETSLVRARVQQEAQSLAQLSHPNIVQVYEVGQTAGQIYIAMEYIQGISLAAWQRPHLAARPSVEQILRIYLQAAAGLFAAHRSGLVHRDFKPENVILGDDGRPRILDFGIARALNGQPLPVDLAAVLASRSSVGERLTQAGTIMGTPGYMSPEQVRGEEADARSDQFSFCAALYDALCQRLPFDGETFAEFAREVLAGRLLPLPVGEIPITVEQALRRGLSTDPAARYPSMQELIAALEIGLHPDSESPATRRASRLFGILVAAGICLTVGLSPDRNRPIDGDLRPAVVLAGMFCLLLVATVIALRRTLLQRRSYQRLVFFALVCVIYCLVGRIFGYWLGVTSNRFLPLEMLAFGGLLALETPNASPRYAWLAALAWVSALLLVLLPRFFWVVLNTTDMLLLLLSVWYRVRAASSPFHRDKKITHLGRGVTSDRDGRNE